MSKIDNHDLIQTLSLTTDLEPYRANRDIWKGIWEAEKIPKEKVEAMIDILADKEKPLVIISHDDADGLTPSMQFMLAREALVSERNTKDVHINLATGSSKEACKAIFEQYEIPDNANIVILDLNQDKPVEALKEMGLTVAGRVDHHQVGKMDFEAKIVPTSADKQYTDSSSVLVRAILDNLKFHTLAFRDKENGSIKMNLKGQAKLMAQLDNLALLGLVGDKKHDKTNPKNRLNQAFSEEMKGMAEPYKRIATALNLMAIHPTQKNSKYETAKIEIFELLRETDHIDNELADKFEAIEHIAIVKGLLDRISNNIEQEVETIISNEVEIYQREGSKSYPGLSIEIVSQGGFKGLKVTINETGQTEDIYDMVEPLWKAVYEKMKGKHDLDYIIMAVEENKTKLSNEDDPRTINYRVGTLKPRAVIDNDTNQVKKDGLMLSAIKVAKITDIGGGHEERAGDKVEVGESYKIDDEVITINNVNDLHNLMIKRSLLSLNKPKSSMKID